MEIQVDCFKHTPNETWPGLLAAKKIIELTGSSRAHFYDLVREGKFPPPAFRDGPRFTRWRASDVQSWLSDPQAWIDAHAAVAA